MTRKQERVKAHAIKMGNLKPKNNYSDDVYGKWKHGTCYRCSKKFNPDEIFKIVCPTCLAKNTFHTTDEKTILNKWDSIDDVIKVLEKMKAGDWSWANNYTCKYLDVRIDMRDGGAIIWDNDGQRVGPDAINWQYSEETPDRPNT